MNFGDILKESYHTFTDSGKKIADYIIQEPDSFLSLSAVGIGEECGTSSASVIRFARTLGFSSLEDLKINIAKNMSQISEVESLSLISSKDDSTETLLNKLINHTVLALKITAKELDLEDVDESVNIILNAKHVYLYGIGASGLAAYDLYHKLSRADIRAFYNFDTHMALEFSYHIKKDDAVIAFSYSGNTKEVIYAVEQAKKNGAKTIIVTRSPNSKLAQYADILFLVPNIEKLVRIGAISSKYTSMIVGDMLFLSLVNRKYDDMEAGFIETSRLTKKLKEKDDNKQI